MTDALNRKIEQNKWINGAINIVFIQAEKWDLLNEKIVEMTKRRSQLKGAVTKMVQECISFLDKLPNKEALLKLIDTLRTVTTGKIDYQDDTYCQQREGRANSNRKKAKNRQNMTPSPSPHGFYDKT